MVLGIDRHSIATVTRRWFYVLAVIFYLLLLIPISISAYLTFYHNLVPNSIIQAPIDFSNSVASIKEVGSTTGTIDLLSLKYKLLFDQSLNYEVVLNIEILCNRNRIDDIYPIKTDLIIPKMTKGNKMDYNDDDITTTQFILNCDVRHLYHANNWFIPYNLRFWTPPILTNIDKTINLKPILKESINSDNLSKLLELVIHSSLIINHNHSFLQFHLIFDGFRYYIVNYFYTSLFIGVSIFWSILASISVLVAMYFFFTNENYIDLKFTKRFDHDQSGVNVGVKEDPYKDIKVKQE